MPIIILARENGRQLAGKDFSGSVVSGQWSVKGELALILFVNCYLLSKGRALGSAIVLDLLATGD
jgi:hypothetical protein